MTQRYVLDSALLPDGWRRGVVATVADDGIVTDIAAGPAPPDAVRIGGYVVPGMPNAHSHAFQRALAGEAEFRAGARDSFWTWRRAMYRLANRIDPDDLRVIATQLFIEMLKAGYTSVAEFHYLHRIRGEGRAAVEALPADLRLWDAVGDAACDAGIGLTLLPTLYQHADFDAAPLRPEQRRFHLGTGEFLDAVAQRIGAARREPAPGVRIGAAFHSLRAVSLETIREAAAALRAIDPALPIHIHVAEQTLEVRSCLRATGARPIERLLRAGLPDERWCLVHCTHATAAELAGIAASGAAVCASISTEANLGDGFFDALRFASAGGRLCVGSDSQATVDPAEELRWLEYQQRLRRRRRIVLAAGEQAHVGTHLWRTAAQCGARALGQPVGEIAIGRRADWIALDPDHPTLAGAAAETVLDRLLFAGGRAAIRDCLVAGRRVVANGVHRGEGASRERFGALMRRFAAER